MKRYHLGIAFILSTVMLTSCAIDDSSYQVTTIAGEFENDSDVTVSEQTESVSDEETVDLFPSQIQGVYSRDTINRIYYNSCDIVIDEDSILVHYQGDVYQFDADDISDFSYAEPDTYLYDVYDEENDIMGSINVELYADYKAGARICRISNPEQLLVTDCVGFYTKTPYGIPLDSYESLDDYGEFGTIELDPRVRSFFMEDAGDDFAVSMSKSAPFFLATDTHQKYADSYTITVFDENKYIAIEKYAFVFDSIDKAQYCFENIYEGCEPYYIFRIEENIIFVELKNARDQYINTKYKYIDNSAEYCPFVFGQHCFSNGGVTRYYSQPISIEEGYEIIANTAVLEKMFQYGGFLAQQDKVSVEVQGTAINPLICTYWYYDSKGYCFSYDVEKYEENKIHVFSKSCSGGYDDTIDNVFAIGTIELVDDTFYIDIDFYRDCEGINKDNYTEFSITSNIKTTTEHVGLY